MTGKGMKLMSTKEVRKYEVIKMVIEGSIKQRKAGKILDISTRQVRRLKKKLKEEGKNGLIHGLRDKESKRRTNDKVKGRILELRDKKYYDFTLTLMQEKLEEVEKITVCRENLRQILMSEGKWSPVREYSKHYEWRERMECWGEMLQLDGSHHDWLEGRGEALVLMSFIDDATNNVFAEFFEYEGTVPAMTLLKKYIKKHGIPQKIYLDRHTTYKSPKEATIEEQLKGESPQSQFERACKELGIEVIHANSPQAKGRIERSFNTHQDRLVKEMRLAGIKTLEEANKFLKRYYLPKHNRKFSIQAANNTDMHFQPDKRVRLDKILSVKTSRTVRNDYTIRHEGVLYQLNTKLPLKGRKVTVYEDLKGRISMVYGKEKVFHKRINHKSKVRAREYSEKVVRKPRMKKRTKPSRKHPWVTGDSWNSWRAGI